MMNAGICSQARHCMFEQQASLLTIPKPTTRSMLTSRICQCPLLSCFIWFTSSGAGL
jgi:hypothetical protein